MTNFDQPYLARLKDSGHELTAKVEVFEAICKFMMAVIYHGQPWACGWGSKVEESQTWGHPFKAAFLRPGLVDGAESFPGDAYGYQQHPLKYRVLNRILDGFGAQIPQSGRLKPQVTEN